MGLFSDLSSFVVSAVSGVSEFFSSNSGGGGSSSGSHSSSHSSNTQTIYEPDKVRVAELENQHAEILIEGQKDIIEMNARMQVAIIEAEALGLEHKAKVLKSLVSEMNIMAQQRLKLLEEGHFEVVKNLEVFYSEFKREIQNDNHTFHLEILPPVLNTLNQYSEGTTAHKMYANSIEQLIHSNAITVTDSLKGLAQRQQLLIESSIVCKEKTLENAMQLDTNGMQLLEKQIEHKETLHLNAPEKVKSLPSSTNPSE